MITANEKSHLNNLELDGINKVYSGKKGRCCCGCSGKYFFCSEAPANQHRLAIDCNDKMVKKVLGLIKAAAVDDLMTDDNYYALEVEERLYVVYLIA